MRFAQHAKKAVHYNHAHLLRYLESFTERYNMNAAGFAAVFLFAAEDFFTQVYYPTRYGKSFRNHMLLADPEDLNSTPAICNVTNSAPNGQSNHSRIDFVFPLGHRHLELIRYGYAQEVVSAYSQHALLRQAIDAHNPLKPQYIKHVNVGTVVSAHVPNKEMTENVLPSLEHHFLPIFLKSKSLLTISDICEAPGHTTFPSCKNIL